jgi:hypothetical protein
VSFSLWSLSLLSTFLLNLSHSPALNFTVLFSLGQHLQGIKIMWGPATFILNNLLAPFGVQVGIRQSLPNWALNKAK